MKLALIVLGAPCSSQASETALRFTYAALEAGHQIYRVFFYQDGTYCVNEAEQSATREAATGQHWQALQQSHQLDFAVCIGAGGRRGLQLATTSAGQGFAIAGLGQLADAALQADRLLTFGA